MHALQNPLPALFNMNVGVAAWLGGEPSGGITDEVPSSMATSGVTKRTDYIDAQLEALVLFEEFLERILDGGAALQMATVEIHVIAVLGPEHGNRFGVAFLKGINE
jgi:hypothetical protein